MSNRNARIVSWCFWRVGDQGMPPERSFWTFVSTCLRSWICSLLMLLYSFSRVGFHLLLWASDWTVRRWRIRLCCRSCGSRRSMYRSTYLGSDALRRRGFGGDSFGDSPKKWSLGRSIHRTRWSDGHPDPKGRYPDRRGVRHGVAQITSMDCLWEFLSLVAGGFWCWLRIGLMSPSSMLKDFILGDRTSSLASMHKMMWSPCCIHAEIIVWRDRRMSSRGCCSCCQKKCRSCCV